MYWYNRVLIKFKGKFIFLRFESFKGNTLSGYNAAYPGEVIKRCNTKQFLTNLSNHCDRP